MRRTFTKALGVLGAIGLLVVPTTSMALTDVTSIVGEATDVEEDNVIPLGWPSSYRAEECIPYDACPDLEGVAFVTVDISEEMQDYENYAEFEVWNGLLTRKATIWMACSYDANQSREDCWDDDERDWGMTAEDLGEDARELRLFPVQSAPNEYHLRLRVD